MPISILDGPLPPEILFSDEEMSDSNIDELDSGPLTQANTRRNTTAAFGKKDSQQVSMDHKCVANTCKHVVYYNTCKHVFIICLLTKINLFFSVN